MKTPAVLHLDIDAFFAAVEETLDPSLRGKPLIVGGLAHERGVVCTASYAARRFGVHSGMALRTAARKCPQAVFRRGRYHLYSRISRQFFACLHRFSPRVEEVSVDEAYLDVGGSRYLSASVYELAATIKAAAERETGLKISAGLGFSRLGAKLACAAAKPGGFFWLHDEEEWISHLTLDKIPGVGPQTYFILQGLGVRRVHELKQKYISLWKKIFAGHPHGGLERGRPEPASPTGGRPQPASRSLSRETTFPEDIRDEGMLCSHLAYLLDRLAVQLLRDKLFAGRVEVKVRFSDFSTFTQRATLPFPTYSYFLLWQSALPLLRLLLAKKGLPLRLVGAKVEDLQPGRDILPFFSLRDEKMTAGIHRVKERFGFSALST
ncbi:MAG: DNA polymerase IV, partial [Candidatus Aminicenantes bacterium]|nr:DNA polymerase IV [Candidatus Aminicenantes bacterium]